MARFRRRLPRLWQNYRKSNMRGRWRFRLERRMSRRDHQRTPAFFPLSAKPPEGEDVAAKCRRSRPELRLKGVNKLRRGAWRGARESSPAFRNSLVMSDYFFHDEVEKLLGEVWIEFG